MTRRKRDVRYNVITEVQHGPKWTYRTSGPGVSVVWSSSSILILLDQLHSLPHQLIQFDDTNTAVASDLAL